MLSSKTLLCIGAFLPGLVYAQQKNVFIEDSAYYVSRNGFMIGLRDSLPDGYWNLFNSKKGDFNNKNIQEHILETGFFNNGVRDGKFTYYKKRFRNRDSEAKSYISGIYFYENGMLHGYYVRFYDHDIKMEEGFYKRGRKDGLFIKYGPNSLVEKVELFRADTLLDNYSYTYDGRLNIALTGYGSQANGEIFVYDTFYNYNRRVEVMNGKVLKYKEYDSNHKMRKMAEGEFSDCIVLGIYPDCDTIPIDGTITYYDDNQFPYRKDQFKNAQKINTIFFRRETDSK